MSEYQRLQAQIAELQKQAAAIREAEKQATIISINELILAFDLTADELTFSCDSAKRTRSPGKQVARPTGGATTNAKSKRHPTAGTVLPARFRDDQGNTWSGRGLQPKWLREAIAAGNALESFRIAG